IINDSVKTAMEADPAGVHVGQQDMRISEARRMLGEEKIIGASARTVEQALKAESEGADYLGVGAVFGTNTKQDAKTIDRKLLREICDAVKIPVVAIGGVSEENIMELAGTGAAGVAVVSAVFAKEDIMGAAKALRNMAGRLFGQQT
ncbi:MAG: thiamine phosphate synthase, partial [Lachnospiraceae bacterium]|nr:thiamine phosphate synthase [Lachnospiraceae bacterium]